MNLLNFESSVKKIEKGEVYLDGNFKIFLPKNDFFSIERLNTNDYESYSDINSMDKYEEVSKEKIKDISKIEFNINDLFKFDSINLPKSEDIKLKKKRGRKRKSPKIEKKEPHNKYSDDNIIKKYKHLVLKYTLEFINNKIKKVYNGNIENGPVKKELQIINNSQISNSHAEFNKNFIKKKLGEIFSENISGKYKNNYPSNHNKLLIEELMNEKDENKKIFFNKLFNLNFIQCLDHFIGKKYIKELNGLQYFEQIKDNILNKYKEDGNIYIKYLDYYLKNFEKIVNIKEPRKSRKKNV